MHAQTSTAVDYSKLIAGSAINARMTGRKDGLDELAASIKAKGLIQPLVVRKADGGKYQIIAGNRRHAAIGVLIKSKDWPASERIPVIVRQEDDSAALETSLAENTVRVPMHPVDQHEVFAKLAKDEDMTPADIAARFGLPERAVRQNMALGNLDTAIRKAWRAGEIDAKTAQAFAICPDKKRQAKLYSELSKGNNAHAWRVRQELLSNKPKIDDARLRFIGVDAYRAAGGVVVESLFENDGFIDDGALLDRLVAEKLQAECKRLVDEDGWAWAVPASEAPNFHGWPREFAPIKYTKEEAARIKAIDAALEKIEADDALPYHEQDAASAPLVDEREEIEDRAAARAFSKQQKAGTGCVLVVNDNGFTIVRGLKKKQPGKGTANDAGSEPEQTGKASSAASEATGISNALALSLTELQTVAAARALMATPELAVKLAIAGLDSSNYAAPVKLSSSGFQGLDVKTARGEFHKVLKKLDACEDLQAEFARVVAASFDLRVYSGIPAMHSGKNTKDPTGGTALVAALSGEAYLKAMREVFQPEDYFARAPAKIAIAALVEIEGRNTCISKKKADIAVLAASSAKRTGWLPRELRHPDYAIDKSQTADAINAGVTFDGSGKTTPKAKRRAKS